MITEIKFNINYHVKVKLTPYGVSCLYKNYQNEKEVWDRLSPNQFTVKLDDDGYYRTQLWVLMEELGKYVTLAKTPFETEIILLNEELKRGI